MMEYSIGSVADLISGSTTPNKPKVVKKQFTMKLKKKVLKQTGIKNIQSKKVQKKINRKPKSDHIEKPIQQVEESDIKIIQTKKVQKKINRKRKSDCIEKPIPQADKSDKEATVIESKKKRSTSPNIKPKDSDEITDVKESDTSDDEELTNNSKKKKEIKNIAPKNPDHVTVFVGNLPISTTHQKLQKQFSKFGDVINARIRSIPVADLKISKKVAAIKKQFHPDRKSVHGYVTFATRTDAENALTLNGQEYEDHHIRVNICDEQRNPDKTKAIFLGNVSFAAEEEELWKLFESCGEIESVRLVRDRRTDIGKGFGYINFKSADSVELALQMGEVTLRDRVLRISLYNGKAPKKTKDHTNHKNIKKVRNQKNEALATTATNGEFQGKFASEKKKKFNKGNQQRKKLAKKIAPKTISS